jgi:hypothetical protein
MSISVTEAINIQDEWGKDIYTSVVFIVFLFFFVFWHIGMTDLDIFNNFSPDPLIRLYLIVFFIVISFFCNDN